MTYNVTIRFSYTSDSQDPPSKYFPESVDRKTIIVESPGAEELNIHQYYELFKNFLGAAGFCEYSIMDGACRIAFNDCNDEAQMKRLMNEYDLQDKQAYDDDDARAMEDEIRDLKAKLSRYEQPDNPQYTDAEIDAMTYENENEDSRNF
tara:strand:+ start:55 stop:501 length:447 start_codon:yes stop_codon:yes gene_type:complete